MASSGGALVQLTSHNPRWGIPPWAHIKPKPKSVSRYPPKVTHQPKPIRARTLPHAPPMPMTMWSGP